MASKFFHKRAFHRPAYKSNVTRASSTSAINIVQHSNKFVETSDTQRKLLSNDREFTTIQSELETTKEKLLTSNETQKEKLKYFKQFENNRICTGSMLEEKEKQ